MQQTKRILIVDDHADLLDIMKEVLMYENYEVKCAASGSQIISMAILHQPDLIIIDCHLSGCNSTELCKTVKLHPKTSHIPVIICSAYLTFNGTAAFDYNCDAVMAKPYNMTDLLTTVNSFLAVES